MGGSVIGALLRFDCEKRELFHPTAPLYPEFDGQIGLCLSETKLENGSTYVSVQWLKPVKYHDRVATISHFQLDNFSVVGAADAKE